MKTDPFSIDSDSIQDKNVDGFHARQYEAHFADEAGGTISRLQFVSNRSRLRAVTIGALVVMAVFALRLTQLQLVQGWIHRASAEENRISIRETLAPRGLIYDRNGEVLVRNVPTFSLFIVPSKLPGAEQELADFTRTLGNELQMDSSEIAERIERGSKYYYEPILIQEGLNYEDATRHYVNLRTLPAVQLEVQAERNYIAGDTFGPILGYMGKLTEEEYLENRVNDYALNDQIGKSGLEKTYENAMRGTKGKQRVEVDVLNNEQKLIAETDPVPGHDVILGIDAGLQRALQDSLARAIEEGEGVGGAAVAIDPRNGEIRALVNSPTFDNNLFVGGISEEDYSGLLNDETKPLFSRAWAGTFPSGSTIKPFWAAAGLQEGNITRGTTVLSTGAINVGPWRFPDWKPGGHGRVGVIESIGWSVNTFFYALGGGFEHITGLGAEALKMYGERFGFNAKTGIDIPGEATGFLPDPAWKEEAKDERWYIGDTYLMSIGQGDVLVTPLQMAAATAAVANGGTLYQPHVVSKTVHGNVQYPVHPVITMEQVVDSRHIETVREGMRYTVTQGSAKRMQEVPIATAAKTGTAQFDSSDQTHAWFTAFAPYDDPELVLAIVVEKGGGGATTALPVALDAYKYYFGFGEPETDEQSTSARLDN